MGCCPTSGYVCRYDTRSDVKFEKDAPIIGLVLQRSHLVTGDEGHYAGVVSNLESRGAKVHPVLQSIRLVTAVLQALCWLGCKQPARALQPGRRLMAVVVLGT